MSKDNPNSVYWSHAQISTTDLPPDRQARNHGEVFEFRAPGLPARNCRDKRFGSESFPIADCARPESFSPSFLGRGQNGLACCAGQNLALEEPTHGRNLPKHSHPATF